MTYSLRMSFKKKIERHLLIICKLMYREIATVLVVLKEKKKGVYMRQEKYSLHHFALEEVSKPIRRYDRAEYKYTENI